MKNQNILEVIAQVNPFIRPQNPQRKADERPHVNDGIVAAVMLTELMNLGMTVVATRDTVIRTSLLDLLILQPAEFQPLFLKAGLQKAATAAATIIIGPVWVHIDKILLAHDRLDHKTQIFGNRIPEAFAHDLARILNGKFNFQILVPVGIDLQLSFPNPLRVVFVNVFDLKLVGNVEFFQSCQD